MELSDYIRVLRKSWLIIVAAALVGVAAAAAYSLTRTPIFSSESQVFVSTQGAGTIGELQQGNTFSQARVTTYTNLATTPLVLQPAIDEPGPVHSYAQGSWGPEQAEHLVGSKGWYEPTEQR